MQDEKVLQDFERRFAGILAETAIGSNLHLNLENIRNTIKDTNEIIDNSVNKPSENTGLHVYKSRLIYLSDTIIRKIKEVSN